MQFRCVFGVMNIYVKKGIPSAGTRYVFFNIMKYGIVEKAAQHIMGVLLSILCGKICVDQG